MKESNKDNKGFKVTHSWHRTRIPRARTPCTSAPQRCSPRQPTTDATPFTVATELTTVPAVTAVPIVRSSAHLQDATGCYRMLQDGSSRWWEEMGRQSPFPSTVEQFTNSQELLVFHPRIRLLQITHYYLARFNTNVDDCKGGQDCWVCTAYGGTDARHVRFSWYYLARTIGTTGTDVILY